MVWIVTLFITYFLMEHTCVIVIIHPSALRKCTEAILIWSTLFQAFLLCSLHVFSLGSYAELPYFVLSFGATKNLVYWTIATTLHT